MKFIHVFTVAILIIYPQISFADVARGYITTGVGSLEKCKRVVIQVCDSEKISIPTSIDSSDPTWSGVYHNTRKDGTSMCWFKVKNGAFSVETLSFPCSPIN